MAERHGGGLVDAALPDGGDHLVAGNRALAAQPDDELAIQFCARQLGPAQRAGILVLSLRIDVGNLRLLFLFPATVQ